MDKDVLRVLQNISNFCTDESLSPFEALDNIQLLVENVLEQYGYSKADLEEDDITELYDD